MALDTYIAFVVATIIMILLPGASVMLTIGHSISHGTRAALLTVAGTSAAIVLQLLVTAAGMTFAFAGRRRVVSKLSAGSASPI